MNVKEEKNEKELEKQENEKKTLKIALELVKENLKKENLDHALSVWGQLDEKDKELVTEYCEMPKKIAEELCNDGRYKETVFLGEKSLPLLKKIIGENHLEVAIMHRYLGNAYGDVGKHDEKKKNLVKALEIFGNHLKGNSEEFFKQALSTSTFKEDFESVKDQSDDKKKGVWIRVLKVQITRTKRNLGNAYGELGDFKEKRRLLEEALETFEKYKLKVDIADTKRNLGNAYGKLGYHQKRIQYLEEALPTLIEHYGPDSSRVKKALGNLAKARKNLTKR